MFQTFTLIKEDDADYSIQGFPETARDGFGGSAGYGVCGCRLMEYFPYLELGEDDPEDEYGSERPGLVLLTVSDDDEDLDFALECYFENGDDYLTIDGNREFIFNDLRNVLADLDLADGSSFYVYAEPVR